MVGPRGLEPRTILSSRGALASAVYKTDALPIELGARKLWKLIFVFRKLGNQFLTLLEIVCQPA